MPVPGQLCQASRLDVPATLLDIGDLVCARFRTSAVHVGEDRLDGLMEEPGLALSSPSHRPTVKLAWQNRDAARRGATSATN